MKITEKTKLKKILPLIDIFPEILEKLRNEYKKKIDTNYFDFFGMTILEFLNVQNNIYPKKINKLLKKRNVKFLEYVKILNTFEFGISEMLKILENTEIELSFSEKIASSTLLKMTAEENILLTLKDFYNLQNFEDAQKLTLYEYITALKSNYNKITFQKNINNLKTN